MSEESHVTVGEFSRAMASLQSQVQAGFERNSRDIANVSRGIHKRLDRVDDDVTEHGEAIAVLKVKVAGAEKGNKKTSSTWGAAVAALITVAVEALRRAFSGGQ